MHLKFEGRWVYLLIIPACILATILTLALVPDQSLKPEDIEAEETSRIVPAAGAPGPAPAFASTGRPDWLDRSSGAVG
jgi:hypothetical protein